MLRIVACCRGRRRSRRGGMPRILAAVLAARQHDHAAAGVAVEVGGDVGGHGLVPQGLGLDEAAEGAAVRPGGGMHAVEDGQSVGIAGNVEVAVRRQGFAHLYGQGVHRTGLEDGAHHLLFEIESDHRDPPAAGEVDDLPVIAVVVAPDLEIARGLEKTGFIEIGPAWYSGRGRPGWSSGTSPCRWPDPDPAGAGPR